MNDLILPDPRPSRADAVKNRARLLETAARLFDTHGIDAVSMSQVAQEAGVGKGTLYRHFNSKTALALALLDQEQRALQERTLQRLRSDHDAPPLALLRWFMAEVLAFTDRHLDLLYIANDASAPPTLELGAHQWWRQTIRALLQRAQPPGDVDLLTETLFVLVDVNTLRYLRVTRGHSVEQVHVHLLTTIDRLCDHAP